jgi:hypothetical protein
METGEQREASSTDEAVELVKDALVRDAPG